MDAGYPVKSAKRVPPGDVGGLRQPMDAARPHRRGETYIQIFARADSSSKTLLPGHGDFFHSGMANFDTLPTTDSASRSRFCEVSPSGFLCRTDFRHFFYR